MLRHLQRYANNKIMLQGTVIKPPDILKLKSPLLFFISTEALIYEGKAFPVNTICQVKKWGAKQRLSYGDRIIIQGKFRKRFRAHYSRSDDMIFYSVSKDPISLIDRTKGLKIISVIYRIREKLIVYATHYLTGNALSLTTSMIFGERGSVEKKVINLFRITGTIHVLAISGLHTAIIAFIFIAFFKIIRLPQLFQWVMTAFLLIAFVPFSGTQIPVIRAVIMSEIFLIGLIINREVDTVNSLSIAALIMLVAAPNQLWDIGFQLSFMAVLWICLLTPIITHGIMSMPSISKIPFKWIKKSISYITLTGATSSAAWIGTMPLIAYYFGIVNPISILANFIIIPLSFCLLSAGFCFFIFGYFCHPLGFIFSKTITVITNSMIFGMEFFSIIPGAYFSTGTLPIWWVLLVYGSLVFLLWAFSGKINRDFYRAH